MINLIKQKMVYLESDDTRISFSYKYVEKKHKGVLRKALERSEMERNFKNDCSPLRIFIVECEREAGYLNQSYPTDEKEHYIENSKEEITLEQLEKKFI